MVCSGCVQLWVGEAGGVGGQTPDETADEDTRPSVAEVDASERPCDVHGARQHIFPPPTAVQKGYAAVGVAYSPGNGAEWHERKDGEQAHTMVSTGSDG